ncbi:MAG: amidohydrolase family protein [Armatimonadetes bacterium]|nr:amidohydrolase family protein [Armatimonadota bacterium]
MTMTTRLRTLAMGMAVLSAALWSSAGARAGERYAIRAGKIVTITQGTVDHGVILVRNGKIEAIGPADQTPVPKGYALVDVGDRWVMPGMVEVHAHIGIAGGLNDMVSQTNPGMRIGDVLDPEDQMVKDALSVGITTIHAIPGSGTNHAGFGVIYKTAGATRRERLLRPIGAMKIAQFANPERPAGDIGRSLMGMTWLLRDYLQRARAYAQRPASAERDLALEQAALVFRGEAPVLIHTYQTWGMAMTMHMFQDEFNLPAIASHSYDSGHRMATDAARRGFRVDVGPGIVDLYGAADGRMYGVTAQYHRAGVDNLTVSTDSPVLPESALPDQAAVSARFGVDDETALRLVTINAARALLVDRRIGSLEPGKDADLVVKRTSLLDPTTPVEIVFINGKIAHDSRPKP